VKAERIKEDADYEGVRVLAQKLGLIDEAAACAYDGRAK
jgi:hypothetical protein